MTATLDAVTLLVHGRQYRVKFLRLSLIASRVPSLPGIELPEKGKRSS